MIILFYTFGLPEEKVHNEKYQALLSKLEADNNDNVEVLKLLIHPKLNHQLPLLDCAKNKRVKKHIYSIIFHYLNLMVLQVLFPNLV